jgi:putative tricarboxylic transport membrane protein
VKPDRLLLLALVGVAGAALLATPALITPFPKGVPWYESAAMFPRVALALAVLGGLAEVVVRRKPVSAGGSEELDSSQVRMPLALAMLALFLVYALLVPVLGFFVSTTLYLLASSAVLGLPWRVSVMLSLPLAAVLWFTFVRVLKVAFGHGWLF